ncbi:MAG: methyltransferase [Pirellulaceae bacterium]
MRFRELVYEATYPLLALVRSNRLLIKRLFDISIPSQISVSFDPTTVTLRHAVCDALSPDDESLFEMGIGQAALVGLSVAKQRDLRLYGADCSRQRVESSTLVAQRNGLEASFVLSDLFAQIDPDDRFDVICFNVPYVPTQQGQQLQLTKRLRVDGDQVWDGGSDGTQVLRRFLGEATHFLRDHGRVVFGVQNLFVSDALVLDVLRDCEYALVKRYQKRYVPSCCYVVQPINASVNRVLDPGLALS